MRYNKYTNLILEEIEGETDINLKIRKLSSIKDQINKTKDNISDMISKLIKNLLKCPNCTKYFEPKTIITDVRTELVKNKLVRDYGPFGDDAEFADVTYQVFFKKCPFCHKDVEVDRYSIKESNRTNRWGEKR